MTKKLWAEDINSIGLDLISRYPLVSLSDEDKDVFLEQLDAALDPYCDGYQNYN